MYAKRRSLSRAEMQKKGGKPRIVTLIAIRGKMDRKFGICDKKYPKIRKLKRFSASFAGSERIYAVSVYGKNETAKRILCIRGKGDMPKKRKK